MTGLVSNDTTILLQSVVMNEDVRLRNNETRRLTKIMIVVVCIIIVIFFVIPNFVLIITHY